MTRNKMINEILKNDPNFKIGMLTISMCIEMIYVIYKDIEKIKNHLGIE